MFLGDDGEREIYRMAPKSSNDLLETYMLGLQEKERKDRNNPSISSSILGVPERISKRRPCGTPKVWISWSFVNAYSLGSLLL